MSVDVLSSILRQAGLDVDAALREEATVRHPRSTDIVCLERPQPQITFLSVSSNLSSSNIGSASIHQLISASIFLSAWPSSEHQPSLLETPAALTGFLAVCLLVFLSWFVSLNKSISHSLAHCWCMSHSVRLAMCVCGCL